MRKYERPAKHSGLEQLRNAPGICSCQKLRSASRAATRLYDTHLRAAGITIGQYSLLAALYYVPSMSVKKLANRLEMDRTTLTRSLARLDRDGFVAISSGAEDTRVRSVSITEAGLEKLAEAYPHWIKAQEEMQEVLGQRGLKDFRRTLDGAIGALKAPE
ncbi:MarR family transcriptional regulator [Bradyrhizobium sp. Arg68]|uniref:MarR family winged helix-turn-helix transcriptional regulator n=1 Tax=Bradyrhizobium ivorense TaxID=2511166 RepID=UPI001E5F9E98|nr:MarR family transcriptional regulator [Bradyrhizobium ivorense]MCC8936590.1 MarR family transcriptional regulator [Bradyrhizobium ivorense]